MLALRLPNEIERRLAALAKRTGRSKSFYAREAILEHLDDLEAEYLSDQILKRVQEGKEQTCTLDELERELGQNRHSPSHTSIPIGAGPSARYGVHLGSRRGHRSGRVRQRLGWRQFARESSSGSDRDSGRHCC